MIHAFKYQEPQKTNIINGSVLEYLTDIWDYKGDKIKIYESIKLYVMKDKELKHISKWTVGQQDLYIFKHNVVII